METCRSEQTKQKLTALFRTFDEACPASIPEDSDLYQLLVVGLYASILNIMDDFIGSWAEALKPYISPQWLKFMKGREFWKSKAINTLLTFNELPKEFPEYNKFSMDLKKITTLKVLNSMFPNSNCLKEKVYTIRAYKEIRDSRNTLVHSKIDFPDIPQIQRDKNTLFSFVQLLIDLKDELDGQQLQRDHKTLFNFLQLLAILKDE